MVMVFRKKLTKTDVEKRLTIPIKSPDCLLPLSGNHMEDLDARDQRDRVWKFRICTSKKKKRHPNPVIIGEWREFVRSKELRVGDRVAFYMVKEQAGGFKYRVKAEKQFKMFGNIVVVPC